MKIALVTIGAIAALGLVPSLAMAGTINDQLTQSQISGYCATATDSNASDATFDLGNGKILKGTVDCSGSSHTSLSAANGADDHGMESANDADSSHED